ncbi:branched-chain amino acid aminotransferase [Herbaspirillum sp. YR522]|uniref:branched-chain amino acid aminotransferase n=1 Tax=Herbaspirillum sp. YR522 TaxID=1144342 RepID=UPI00026F90A5|nr:branched-chain amino acid aminotransferase [Herbaspirillum sp. YR522]EJN09841.1 branched-chain amino acid aminotransferase, group II [Herbaspirillum sp. YR522]
MTTQNFFSTQQAVQTPADVRAAAMQNPGFGSVFSANMASARYTVADGWHGGQIAPYAPLTIPPSALVFHYAQEIFEGLKVYSLEDGGISLFRPEANASRFAKSAERLAMPPLPVEVFLESVQQLALIDKDWIPKERGSSLYLRPVMFATQAVLGVKPASEYSYFVLACPVGDYFKDSNSGISLWVSENFSRAGIGGTGEAKCGGNYAASLAAQAEAQRQGCDQVVFLDSRDKTWVEELGGMNIFFVFKDGTIQTPPLGGTILPGVTRDSLLKLAASLGIEAREEQYSIQQWEADARSGKLVEAFACGTAAVITPIRHVKRATSEFSIGDAKAGKITLQLKNALLDIQRGAAEDTFGWVKRLA